MLHVSKTFLKVWLNIYSEKMPDTMNTPTHKRQASICDAKLLFHRLWIKRNKKPPTNYHIIDQTDVSEKITLFFVISPKTVTFFFFNRATAERWKAEIISRLNMGFKNIPKLICKYIFCKYPINMLDMHLDNIIRLLYISIFYANVKHQFINIYRIYLKAQCLPI